MQFIFLLPALWMLSADVSDKHFLCQNKSHLSSLERVSLRVCARVLVTFPSQRPYSRDELVSVGLPKHSSPGAVSGSHHTGS